jgi:restriction system protein
VDLVLTRGRERIFVQCKHYAMRSVDVRLVRELFGVTAAERATGAIFVSSDTYTSAAREFARRNRIALVDATELLRLLEEGRIAHSGRTQQGTRTAVPRH